jgi:hypothetical protein
MHQYLINRYRKFTYDQRYFDIYEQHISRAISKKFLNKKSTIYDCWRFAMDTFYGPQETIIEFTNYLYYALQH